ncbi:MAG TPA: sigma-54-dependent Fis family transcriptional regulator [Myxococcales bacterium]|nr:sigma-54-dependent Fis family transcriptional regulator [Myxococcales bacterium]HIL99900.1 sigma-54-dependent Fis family transcriptional regulator [Myxococcales bacterium]
MTAKARVLIVDDERSMQEFLEIFFRREGYEVTTASDVASATLCLENDDFDLLISDMQMPDGSGLDLLRVVRASCEDTVTIMITAFATTDSAIAAMKDGAYDYITKPFKVDEIRLVVEKALEKKLLASENQRLRSELRVQKRKRQIIGTSSVMQRVYDFISQVADTRINVLVSGASGTGKELVARAIHDQSDRADKPFVAINCGAIPENLLESELFGHVRGSFTGAVSNKEGLFEAADNGSLFLDEIGELSMPLQVKLLRVLQEKSIRRVGGTSDRSVNVRLISATNRRLDEEVGAGRFREDLFYRLNVMEIPLPTLAERREDIPLLVSHFVEKFSKEIGKAELPLEAEALDKLMVYDYPGNVRELENIVERAVALSRGDSITIAAFPDTILRRQGVSYSCQITDKGVDLEDLVNNYERSLIGEAMRASGSVKKRAAQLLGISFRSFRYRFEKLGLDHDDRPKY